jgi:hypothetical protein
MLRRAMGDTHDPHRPRSVPVRLATLLAEARRVVGDDRHRVLVLLLHRLRRRRAEDATAAAELLRLLPPADGESAPTWPPAQRPRPWWRFWR